MKTIILWLFAAIGPCLALAQSKITRSYPVTKGQTVALHFDYPKVVRISTWSGNEVMVEASVKINNSESTKGFTLSDNTADGQLSISNKIDMDQIPESFYVIDSGKKVRFPSRQDMETYVAQNGGRKMSHYQTRDIEVTIEVKVPVNVSTSLTALYGMVEVKDFNGPIKVDARYGGMDVSIAEKSIGKVQLLTNYGKIYTDLKLQPTEQTQRSFFTSITATPGTGPGYDLKSTYGNIYLRNAKQ